MPVVCHSDVIGSLLRPRYLLDARQDFEEGRVGAAELKGVEDRAVDAAIAMQEGVGLDVVSDGELRRFSFFDHLLTQMEGLSPSDDTPGVKFHAPQPGDDWDFHSPLVATERLRRKRMLTVEEFTYARAVARKRVKALLPSPLFLYTSWSPRHSTAAYPDPFDLFADAARLLKEEAEELARLGCTYVQVDAPDLGTLVDPENRSLREARGMPTERTLSEGMELINS
ncbi:MAG: cobalamin-independent methionine synthase II family protein, partial [Acidimicrobiales bacterium]